MESTVVTVYEYAYLYIATVFHQSHRPGDPPVDYEVVASGDGIEVAELAGRVLPVLNRLGREGWLISDSVQINGSNLADAIAAASRPVSNVNMCFSYFMRRVEG